MYKVKKTRRSTIRSVDRVEGERLIDKVARMMKAQEPITDGAPQIYTEKKDGVISAYNIRADRFDIAVEMMDTIHRGEVANRQAPSKPVDGEAEMKLEKGDGGTESIQASGD